MNLKIHFQQILILLLLYGKQENQILCQEIREGFPTAAPSTESNVDMNPSNEELYMIDDPEIMKVLLPKLEGFIFPKNMISSVFSGAGDENRDNQRVPGRPASRNRHVLEDILRRVSETARLRAPF